MTPLPEAAVAGLATATVLAAGAARRGRSPRRLVAARVPTVAVQGAVGPSRSRRRRAGRLAAPTASVAPVLAALVGFAAGQPVAAVAITVAWPGARWWAAQRAQRREQGRLERAVPDLLDLFVVVAAAGHPVGRCLELVAGRAPGPVREACRAAVDRRALGAPLSDVLAELGARLGPGGVELAETLAGAAVTGAPLQPPLARLAAAERDRRRRRAEESARRLPVSLLFPLVCCILPAFALLAVVPLLAASLGSLQL